MITTTAAGRTWHYSHNLGRQTAEHNQSKFGRTGGYCFPMDVAAAGNDILFVLSRGYGFENVARGFDIYLRIGKTTIDEDHIGDFARGGFTWPVGIASRRATEAYSPPTSTNARFRPSTRTASRRSPSTIPTASTSSGGARRVPSRAC